MLSSFEIFSYKLPSPIGKRRGLLIRITDNSGRTGIGEIAPFAGVNFETLQEATEQTKLLREKFLHGDMSPLTLLPSVHFGLASALRHLSSPAHDITFETIQLLRENETPSLKQVKLKIGHLPIEEAVRECRLLLEKGSTLRLDVNGKWELEKTCQFCSYFSPKDFLYIEDPVHRFTDFTAFYEKTGFPFAVDYPLLLQPLEKIVSLKGLSYLVIKPMALGGYERLKEIKEKAEGIPLVFSNTYETPVGLLHTIELANSLSPGEPIGIDPVVTAPFFASTINLRSGLAPKTLFEKMPILFTRLTKI